MWWAWCWTYSAGFHPLKAGRRRDEVDRAAQLRHGFHPLKAGRRLVQIRTHWFLLHQFPSPQGGSETFK